jgi:tetratricopeptide (TPR) repeat protein
MKHLVLLRFSSRFLGRRLGFYGAALVALCCLWGCSTTRIQVPVLRPAEINTGGFKRAVVLGFKNTTVLSNEGDQLEFTLARRLVETNRFTVIDKALFDQSMRSQATTTNDVLVISGVVNEYSYTENIVESKPYQRDGKTFVDYRRNGAVRLGVSFQVSRTSNAQILGGRALLQEIPGSSTATNGQPPPLVVASMVAEARERLVAAFLKKIVPYEEIVGVDFYSEKTIPELDYGITAAQQGDWDTALQTFGMATDKYTTNKQVHVAWYNLALALQCVARFAEAEQAFLRAIRLDPTTSEYQRALERCRQLANDYRRVQQESQ